MSEDAHLFRQGAENIKERSVEEKRIWLLSIRAAEARKKSFDKRCRSREARQDARRFLANNASTQTTERGCKQMATVQADLDTGTGG